MPFYCFQIYRLALRKLKRILDILIFFFYSFYVWSFHSYYVLKDRGLDYGEPTGKTLFNTWP